MTGYPDKTPNNPPPIESVAGYRKGANPDAATFNKGATDRAAIERATEARREHSRQLTNRDTGPHSYANRDSRGVK